MNLRSVLSIYVSATVAVTLASGLGHIWGPSKVQAFGEAITSLIFSVPFGAFYGLLLTVPLLLAEQIICRTFRFWKPRSVTFLLLVLAAGGTLGVGAGYFLEGRINDSRVAITYLFSGMVAGLTYAVLKAKEKVSL